MNLIEFSAWIQAHVRDYEAGDSHALSQALAPFVDVPASRRLLSSILDDDYWLDIILQNSYSHPNGFHKIVLLSNRSCQARLHIWRTPDRLHQDLENIHNHRWDFSSILLVGGYRYAEFTLSEEGKDFYAYSYDSQRGTSTYALKPLGRRVLRCSYDGHMGVGSSYTLKTEAFHRVISDPGRTTATLVLQGMHRKSAVLVFNEQARPTGGALLLPRFSRASLIYDLEALLAELNETN